MKQFKGRDGLTEYLVTDWEDGEDGAIQVAIRSVVAGTWSAPVVLHPVAAGSVA